VPGISTVSASAIVSEIGCDMSRFPTAGHLVSWSGLCPGKNESAGKRKPSRLRKGAPWLKTMLVQCAWAAKRKRTRLFEPHGGHGARAPLPILPPLGRMLAVGGERGVIRRKPAIA
jgi:transposase